jgi:3-hydroxymyristoyl/3-hydroxydecanoyl-(acyl carrier protein) dehydratase
LANLTDEIFKDFDFEAMLFSHSNISNRWQLILCCYSNNTNKTQICRISNIKNWSFERVVLPGQRLIFEAPQEAELEIHTNTTITAILSDKISCQTLAMKDCVPVLSHKTV